MMICSCCSADSVLGWVGTGGGVGLASSNHCSSNSWLKSKKLALRLIPAWKIGFKSLPLTSADRASEMPRVQLEGFDRWSKSHANFPTTPRIRYHLEEADRASLFYQNQKNEKIESENRVQKSDFRPTNLKGKTVRIISISAMGSETEVSDRTGSIGYFDPNRWILTRNCPKENL